MKIVHIVRQYAPSVGGLEDAVGNLCKHLAAMPDMEIKVVTLDRLFSNLGEKLPAREVIDGIEVERISFFGSKRYPIALGILGAIKDADIVHVHAIDFFFDFLAWTKVFHGKTLVASTHGGFFHSQFAARLKKIYFQIITRLSCMAYQTICASSENDANTFLQIAGSKVVTIENGVDIEKWKGAGSKTSMRTMIFIGRWSDNKRVPILFDLLQKLKEKNQDWKLIIVGVAGHETQETLKEIAKEKSVIDAVEIYEKVPNEKLKELIGAASYLVSASSYEGFGITVVEGLSAGLTPLVTPLPPFKKILDLLGFGCLINIEDLARTAEEIEITHQESESDYDARFQLCCALSQKYAWADTTQRFVKAYKGC